MDIETIQKLHPQNGDVLAIKLPDDYPQSAEHDAVDTLRRIFDHTGVVVIVSRIPIELKLIPKESVEAFIKSWQQKTKGG